MIKHDTVVETKSGILRGSVEDGTHVFRGIPYAEPPVGEKRFSAPIPKDPWPGVLDARQSGLASYQINRTNRDNVLEFANQMQSSCPGIMAWPGYVGETYNHEYIGEDCLNIDIWVPESSQNSQPLPVYVYYHGGANAVSSGHFSLERGANLAREENIIVVRPTYRLGALGWVHFGLLGDEFPDAVNLGVQDQIAALRWVYDHIAAFGGDPEQITIGGESCGATAVSHLIVNPETQPMIRRAIIQSLSPFNLWCTQPKDEAIRVAKQYLQLLDINDPAELLSIDADKLLAAHSVMARRLAPDENCAWRPLGGVVDGRILPGLPASVLSQHPYPRKDFELMIGFAKDEWQFFRGHSKTVRNGTKEDVFNVLKQVFDDSAEQIYDRYQALYPDHTKPGDILSDIMSFEFFKVSSLAIAHNFAAQDLSVYVFQFSYDLPGYGGYLRAVHTGDIPFIFRNLDESDLRKWPAFDGADRNELNHAAREFGFLYGSFIRSGDPGAKWPSFDDEARTILWFGKTIEPRENLLTPEWNIFAEVGLDGVESLERRLTDNLRLAFNRQ